MIQESLFSALQNASITSLAAGGIWPLEVRQDKGFPQAVYRFVSAVNSPTLDTSGMFRARVQIDCFGETYTDAAKLRAAVLSVLDGYISPASDSPRIQNATIVNGEMDDFEKEARIYRCLCEVYLYYTQ